MDHKLLNSSKSRPSRSTIQVDDDVHFVLDNNNCFPTPSPHKPYEMQQNTYSKKIPVIYQPVASSTPPEIYNVKDKLHSPLILNGPLVPSGEKNVPRKRKTMEGLSCSVPSPPKLQRFKNLSQVNTTRVFNRPVRNGSMKYKRESSPSSSDSDIEIVAIKVTRSITTTETKPFAQNTRKLTNAQPVFNNSFRRGNIKSDPSSKELLVNEADTAPYMPTNPNMFADVGNRVNSMRWLSANGTISVANGNSSQGVDGKCEVTTPPSEKVVILPEIKVENKKPKVKRELKRLYDNLNEISWTHDKSFKKLLENPDYIRHSERSTVAKSIKQEKTSGPTEKSKKVPLTRLKKPSPVSVAAQKKSRIARLSPMKVKIAGKKPIMPKTSNEKGGSKSAVKKGIAKSNAANTHYYKSDNCISHADEISIADDDDDHIKYKFAPSFLKKIAGEGKGKATIPKSKSEGNEANAVAKTAQKGKMVSKSEEKTKPGVKKTSLQGQSTKNNRVKSQPNGHDGIADVPFSMPITIDESSPSTSGTQSPIFNGRNAPSEASSSEMTSFLNNIDFTVSKEMQLMQALGGNGELYSAVQRGSKLRVCLEPLEQTDYWNNDFYDEFRKHMLRQAIRKAFDNRDHESVTEMYHELLESLNPNQTNGNSKVLKKKKPDEENLRISVRQSEGAFRYKEIVVKKHPNYMQVVLVPNSVKHNSLSNEALKELKEAFLLAKKDPHCRAVLLNSSGSYFCSGIELSSLVGSNKKQAAEEMATSVRDLVLTLGFFTKPIIAAVNGDCLGFGVSILTFCDIVLASDKATFAIPATKLGYMPEGAITLTLPQAVGSVVASEMLLQGRRLTAEQALRCGLVSEVLWPTRLMNEVVPRLKNVISQPLSAMEATKTMVRCHLWDKLRSHLDRERRILLEHWQSGPCQNSIKTLLQTGWLAD